MLSRDFSVQNTSEHPGPAFVVVQAACCSDSVPMRNFASLLAHLDVGDEALGVGACGLHDALSQPCLDTIDAACGFGCRHEVPAEALAARQPVIVEECRYVGTSAIGEEARQFLAHIVEGTELHTALGGALADDGDVEVDAESGEVLREEGDEEASLREALDDEKQGHARHVRGWSR